MRAILEIESENPEIIKESIEVDEKENERIKIIPSIENKKLIVTIEADDFSALRAGVTSYMRLVKTCVDAEVE